MIINRIYSDDVPIIKCPKCKMMFVVDNISYHESKYTNEKNPEKEYYIFAHQGSNKTFCFYCGHKLTKRNLIDEKGDK
jgi:hypothetical protein